MSEAEGTDLVTREDAPPPVAVNAGGTVADVAALLGTFMTLAANPAIDAEKLREIRLTVNEATQRAKEEEFSRDKAAAVRAMPIIRKDGRIVIAGKNGEPDRVQGHFEKWPDVQRAITPHLIANHLTLTHRVSSTQDGRVVVTAILRHDNGFVEESGEMSLPLDGSGGKNNVQGAGSAQSYGMRYSTRAILGLQFEPGHDDGNLFALADEPLNDQQERRVEEMRQAWEQGEERFEEWWDRLQPQDKAWLIQTGRYAEVTGRQALPGVRRIAAAADAAETPPADGGGARQTVEQRVRQYERACEKAGTLVDLAGVQRRGANLIESLRTDEHEQLYERVLEAGRVADRRLRGGGGGATGGDLLGEGQD